MARKLTVSFGLLTIPVMSDGAIIKAPDNVNLCKGQPGKEVHEHLPLKKPSVCTACGEITDFSVLDKGVKAGKSYTVISQDDLAEAKEKYTREFKGNLNLIPHPAEEFLAATGPGDSVNYLTPADAATANHYQLLVRLIGEHPELAFVSLHTPMSVTALYQVTVRSGVLVMEKRVREQGMKPVPSVGGEVNEKMLTALEMILPSFTAPYDAADYEDTYQAAVDEMVANGQQVQAVTDGIATPVPINDIDLLARLQKLAGIGA